jgi:uncharacterized protein with beta-barrel porin domain
MRGLLKPIAVAVAFLSALAVVAPFAHAQTPSPTPTASPTPTPTVPTPTPTQINVGISSGATVLNLGSGFLERLGNQATGGIDRALRNNPGGGGASEATEGPWLRAWGEAYGISSRTDNQGEFFGDKRTTWGGVAGLGARVAPGVNIGFSADQSRTDVDVPLGLQSATLDLTQLAFNASVDKGPWTWAVALVHGFGSISSSRDTGAGIARVGYRAELNGALTELDYYWTAQESRVVPKLGFEYVRSTTGALQEAGGLDPVAESGATLERSRLLLGAEVGHYWILDQKILDLSGYGRFVDNVSQNFSSVVVSLGTQSITVQGIGESRYGADAGASASLSLSNTSRLYLNYDGKFRSALLSHQGTFGLELKW